jgi:glycogen synthase
MEEGRLHGIVNGIDASWISPIDTRKVRMADVRVWKEHNAAAIRDAFDLAPTHGPLFSIISRLVHQKGIDLSIEAAETIVAHIRPNATIAIPQPRADKRTNIQLGMTSMAPSRKQCHPQ